MIGRLPPGAIGTWVRHDDPPFDPGSDSSAKLACPDCPRKFETPRQLRQHCRDRHGKPPPKEST